jgi:3-phosphoshikimate 1-carboxyvinyltransferase
LTKAIIQPGIISGEIIAPASKSMMQRAVAAALIQPERRTLLGNPGNSADDQAAFSIIKQLGAKVEIHQYTAEITGADFSNFSGILHCGESGLSARLFTALAALSNNEVTITGEGSLNKRPFDFFDEVFPLVGVTCKSNNGQLPLIIKGPLVPANITIDGSVSSQFLTGLIFAYIAAGADGVTIEVENLNSKPYIDLTLQVLDDLCLDAPVNEDYKRFVFKKRHLKTNQKEIWTYDIESDWSGAAFLLVAAAINGSSVRIKGLNRDSVQADRKILQALKAAGVEFDETADTIEISKSELTGFEFDAVDCPDLFPPLIALAAYCKYESRIKGVHRLKHKESDRAATLQEEFAKTGIKIEFEGDEMIVLPGPVQGAVTNSHNDHRIAMALAVAGLGAKGEMIIEGADAVNKSYPDFWKHLSKLNALVSLTDSDHE